MTTLPRQACPWCIREHGRFFCLGATCEHHLDDAPYCMFATREREQPAPCLIGRSASTDATAHNTGVQI